MGAGRAEVDISDLVDTLGPHTVGPRVAADMGNPQAGAGRPMISAARSRCRSIPGEGASVHLHLQEGADSEGVPGRHLAVGSLSLHDGRLP